MEFPHLNDTNFPDFNNVNVYEYQNNFDYSRWDNQGIVRLVNVNFDNSYESVVEFKSVEARDEKFDSLKGHTETLNTNFRLSPEGAIKLPIPFDVANTYNYLYIVVNTATSDNQPIAYENVPKIDRYYFFINGTTQKAPNVTEFNLELDMWTTFYNYVDINSIMLERGHYAVAMAATPEEYLTSPIDNTEYLTTEDFYVQNGKNISNAKALGFSSNKMVCFMLPYDAGKLTNLVTATEGSGMTPATYSDMYRPGTNPPEKYRWGEAYVVNGYSWEMGKNYSSMTTLTPNALCSQNEWQPNQYVYGVHGNDATYFFGELQDKNPNVFQDIQAVFVVEADRIEISNAFTYAGIQVYNCVRKVVQFNIDLTVDDFKIPTRYKKLTKLYTSPYSKVVVTDTYGTVHEIKVQDCTSNTRIGVYVSLSMFKYFAYIDHVGSKQSVSYDVRRWTAPWNANPDSTGVPIGDFEKLMFENDIPLYQISMSTRQQNDMGRYWQSQAMRERAIGTYQNNTRAANTTEKNALDHNTTDNTNEKKIIEREKLNAITLATVARENAKRSAGAERDTNANLAVTNCANTQRTASTQQTNANETAKQDWASTVAQYNAANKNTERNNTANTDMANLQKSLNNGKSHPLDTAKPRMKFITADGATSEDSGYWFIYSNMDYFGVEMLDTRNAMYNGFTQQKYSLYQNATKNTAVSWITGATGTAASMVTAGVAGFAVGGPGGAFASAAAAGIAGAIGVTGTQYSISYQTQTDYEIANKNIESQQEYWEATYNSIERKHELKNEYITNATNIQNASAKAIQDRISEVGGAVALATKNLIDANASRTKTAADSNATGLRDRLVSNSIIIQTAKNTNADNLAAVQGDNATKTAAVQTQNSNDQKTVSDATTIYTRDSNISAYQNDMRITQLQRASVYNNDNFGPAVTITQNAGNNFKLDYDRSGYLVKIETPNENDMKTIGDYFLRYGYSLYQFINKPTKLQNMNYFSYWKAQDVFINSKLVNAKALQFISNIFKKGVTVWSTLEDVNTKNIYENI